MSSPEVTPSAASLQPDPAEGERTSLDQQIRFAGQRITQLEQQVVQIEHDLVELDRRVEESRQTPSHEQIVKEREARSLSRIALLESIATEKRETDILKARRAFLG